MRTIFIIVPTVIMWRLWKRKNTRRHDQDVNCVKLISQCKNTNYQFTKLVFSVIRCHHSWEEMITVFRIISLSFTILMLFGEVRYWTA